MPLTSRTVRAYAAGLITGCAVIAIAAAPHADAQPDRVAIAYADQFGEAVCGTLNDYPSFDGIIGIASVMMDDGLSGRQAGQAIALSVIDLCPWHLALLDNFANSYNGQNTLA